MRFLSNFGCKIIFICSVNFWHQQDSNSLFKGSIGHVTSYSKWPIAQFENNLGAPCHAERDVIRVFVGTDQSQRAQHSARCVINKQNKYSSKVKRAEIGSRCFDCKINRRLLSTKRSEILIKKIFKWAIQRCFIKTIKCGGC